MAMNKVMPSMDVLNCAEKRATA
jgi:hypothetical protein